MPDQNQITIVQEAESSENCEKRTWEIPTDELPTLQALAQRASIGPYMDLDSFESTIPVEIQIVDEGSVDGKVIVHITAGSKKMAYFLRLASQRYKTWLT